MKKRMESEERDRLEESTRVFRPSPSSILDPTDDDLESEDDDDDWEDDDDDYDFDDDDLDDDDLDLDVEDDEDEAVVEDHYPIRHRNRWETHHSPKKRHILHR